jgi:hypothetical protein
MRLGGREVYVVHAGSCLSRLVLHPAGRILQGFDMCYIRFRDAVGDHVDMLALGYL